MKKYCLVFLIFPLLASCKGNQISNEKALKIIESIENEINASFSCDSFTKIERGTKQDNVFEQKACFSKDKKFYHFYSFGLANVIENWRFVNSNSDGDIFIYTVERDFSKESDYYLTSKIEYTENKWKEISDSFVNSVLNEHKTYLLNMKEHAEGKVENAKAEFYSFNDSSIYMKSISEEEYHSTLEVEFSNNKISSVSHHQDKSTDQSKITWDYKEIDVVYPDYEKKQSIK